MNESHAFLILNAIPGLGNVRIRKLMDHFGSASEILNAGAERLAAARILPAEVIQNVLTFPKDRFLQDENALIDKNNINIVNYRDIHYPEHLKGIADAPVVLYVKGALKEEHNLAMAVVGSRNASLYGLNMAEKFAVELAELGITIVSGLARGVDTAAHRGAVRAGGSTLAVVGCGLNAVYPPENRKLAEDISENGAVISEFPMRMQPLAYNFPRRNRIISGLSLGVIVIEASKKSGALITADQALDQGREVFALPGRIDHPNSQGVHGLIKQGAKLIHSIDDILEELKPRLEHILQDRKASESKENKGSGMLKLTEQEQNLLELISNEPAHIDALAGQSGLSITEAMSILFRLEMKRLIRQMPGKRFVKKVTKGY